MEKMIKMLLAADLAALVSTALMLESGSRGIFIALAVELVLMAGIIFAGVREGI